MDENKNKTPWWKPGLSLFFKVSALTIIPIISALFIGKYLDHKFNTSPWLFLGLTFIAFTISIISIWKNLLKYIKNIEKDIKDKENTKK